MKSMKKDDACYCIILFAEGEWAIWLLAILVKIYSQSYCTVTVSFFLGETFP